eukprot:5030757-Amphidinium_carterae.2
MASATRMYSLLPHSHDVHKKDVRLAKTCIRLPSVLASQILLTGDATRRSVRGRSCSTPNGVVSPFNPALGLADGALCVPTNRDTLRTDFQGSHCRR